MIADVHKYFVVDVILNKVSHKGAPSISHPQTDFESGLDLPWRNACVMDLIALRSINEDDNDDDNGTFIKIDLKLQYVKC